MTCEEKQYLSLIGLFKISYDTDNYYCKRLWTVWIKWGIE
jgi:hypothetical protein